MSQLAPNNATRGLLGDDEANLIELAEVLCRQVAGLDLVNHPLYIVPQSRLPDEKGGASICDGYTSLSLDLYVQDFVPAYCGRGPCMVINDTGLARDFHSDDFEYVFLATVLHELAHILERPFPVEDRSDISLEEIEFEALVMASAVTRETPPPKYDLPPYFGHGREFIRTVIHLCWRSEQLGTSIAPAAVFTGYGYGLSHASRYMEALGDEPSRFSRLTFAEILAASPPAAFEDLWRNDIQCWQNSQHNTKGIAL